MDLLPDEVLLMVLGRVDCGETLLAAVPLVCRRWHALARDPRAWASACARVEVLGRGKKGGDCRVALRHARLLQHAPALRLELTFVPFSEDVATTVPLATALDMCRAPVSELKVRAGIRSYTVKKVRHLTQKCLATFSSVGNDDKSFSVYDMFVICDDRVVV